MKTRKGSSIVVILACAVLLSAGTLYTGKAAGSTEYKSQGKIVFDNNTADTADDVVFDAGDFRLIHDMVASGKNQIGAELNKYPSVNLDLSIIPDFNELAGAIDTLTDDATAEDKMILKDYTAYAGGDKITGSMENNGNTTVNAGSVTKDNTYTYFSIPTEGYYDTDSKVMALNSDIEDFNVIISAINNKKSGLKENASKEEIATYIVANWTGGVSNAQIQYQYHHHVSGCYYECDGEIHDRSNGDGYSYTWYCTKCSWTHADTQDLGGRWGQKCGQRYYTCGKNEGQIIGATIVF